MSRFGADVDEAPLLILILNGNVRMTTDKHTFAELTEASRPGLCLERPDRPVYAD